MQMHKCIENAHRQWQRDTQTVSHVPNVIYWGKKSAANLKTKCTTNHNKMIVKKCGVKLNANILWQRKGA